MIRKRKLKLIQITLIILGFIIIFLTYSQNYQNDQRKEILSKDAKNKISKELESKKIIVREINFSILNIRVLIYQVIDIFLNQKKRLQIHRMKN